jgi:lysophospholipase
MSIQIIPEPEYKKQMAETVCPYLEAHKKSGTFDPEGGGEIYYESYRTEDAKAAIIIAHGFTETAEKYQEMIWYFLQAKMQVYCYDMRGHGRSHRYTEDMSIVHIDRCETYIKDLVYFAEKIVKPENEGLPLYLFGHSMGGGISAVTLEKNPELFSKAVLTSPMIKPLTGGIPINIAYTIAKVQCMLGHGMDYVMGHHAFTTDETFEGSASTSPERFWHYQNKRLSNPLFQNSGASYGWLREAIRLSHNVIRDDEVKKIRTKTLLFMADNDEFVDKEAQRAFSEKSDHVKLVETCGTKHEIYMSRDEEFAIYLDKIIDFFQKPLEIKE